MTKGQRALRHYLTKCGHGELSRIARALRVSVPTVHGWARTGRPRFERRAALERATGGEVPADLWMSERERREWEDLTA